MEKLEIMFWICDSFISTVCNDFLALVRVKTSEEWKSKRNKEAKSIFHGPQYSKLSSNTNYMKITFNSLDHLTPLKLMREAW